MKKILTALAILITLSASARVAYLCPVGVTNETAELFGDAPQYMRGPSGAVYMTCWHVSGIENSQTHTNLVVSATIAQDVLDAVAEGKSVGIDGISNPVKFMADFGMTRCDADGNAFPPIPEEE